MRNLGKFADLTAREQKALLSDVQCIPMFAHLEQRGPACFQQAELIEAEAGDRVIEQGEKSHSFWVLLEGGLKAEYIEPDGTRRALADHHGCETFGEVPLLAGSSSVCVECTMIDPSRLLRLDEDAFWQLMTECPSVRKGILANMAARQRRLHDLVLQREKLAALGKMAAGLMHELNNPGTAAQRAAAELRASMIHLQDLNLKNCRMGLKPEAVRCMAGLQDYVLRPLHTKTLDALDQAAAEEALMEWMNGVGIQASWKLAPPLAEAGVSADQLECLQVTFGSAAFGQMLEWLEALIAGKQQVDTIEASITRITELTMAVKNYSYSDKICCRPTDIHKSLQSALMILRHKIRQKEIHIFKRFGADIPLLEIGATELHQVWLNLLDNAIDAAPEKGHVTIRTWVDSAAQISIGIEDDGEGIKPEYRSELFSPFVTSKEEGAGTGLGLSIVHDIVTEHFGGTIHFESEPGRTEFIVRLPQHPLEMKHTVR